MSAEERKRRRDIQKHMIELKKASATQVCFLVDATQSMKDYLTSAKEGVEQLSRDIQKAAPNADVRFAFVGEQRKSSLTSSHVFYSFCHRYRFL